MPDEARLEETESGLKPVSEGWFVVNVGETGWAVHDAFGSGCTFEGRDAQFKQLGINVNVVEPGQPLCLYHCPAGTEHVIVGSGDGLAIVLAVGARPEDEQISYPRSELAERYGASAVETTNDPQEAYTRAGHARPRHERPAYWNDLPWA